MKVKLEWELAQLVSRPHPAAALLADDMDKLQYQYQEEKRTELHKNKREFEIRQEQDLDEQDHVHRNCSVLQSSADWWLSKMAFRI